MNPYIAQTTFAFIQLLTWFIVARALVSWLPIDQSSNLYQALWRITEPVIEPFRRFMPNVGMMDLSPLAAMVALIFLGQIVLSLSAAN